MLQALFMQNVFFQYDLLEPPYGTCGKKELQLFNNMNYTKSHCLLECETNLIVTECNCTMPHMPGYNF